mmetsp:Transcript_26895/g.40706  ORF Transcript_26895/g.40706 Transcript_26895/m.40706 type:complete len:91 (-) Transcript_26895:166-438(-)
MMDSQSKQYQVITQESGQRGKSVIQQEDSFVVSFPPGRLILKTKDAAQTYLIEYVIGIMLAPRHTSVARWFGNCIHFFNIIWRMANFTER